MGLIGLIEQEEDDRNYLLDKRIRDRFFGRLVAHSRNRGENDQTATFCRILFL